MKQIPPKDSWHQVDLDRWKFHPLMPALTLLSLLEAWNDICGLKLPRREPTSENDRLHIYSLWRDKERGDTYLARIGITTRWCLSPRILVRSHLEVKLKLKLLIDFPALVRSSASGVRRVFPGRFLHGLQPGPQRGPVQALFTLGEFFQGAVFSGYMANHLDLAPNFAGWCDEGREPVRRELVLALTFWYSLTAIMKIT